MKRFAALFLAVVLAFSLVACGGQDGAAALKKYVESNEFQTLIQTQASAYEEMGIKLDISVEGEQLIYACSFAEQLDNTDNVLGEAFGAALDQQASTFEGIATQLKTELNIANPTVLVKYVNADGSILASKTFSAK